MRLKLLNGAPFCEQLEFNNDILLDVAECNDFNARSWHGQSTAEEVALKWREVGLRNARLHTGWSQPYLPGTGLQGAYSFAIPGVEESPALPCLDTTNLDTTLTLDEDQFAADDYLQHSLILHDTLMSSQVIQNVTEDDTVNSPSFMTTSFGTTASGASSPSPIDNHVLLLQVPTAMVVTPLGSLPSAQHLRSIYPQTPTPNFLCALMTTPERREVFVHKRGYRMDLWEITMGDDTRANFKVTFWLRPPRESNNEQNNAQVRLLHTLERLQVGNILLLRNVALTSFRDTVYGQSLNSAITRARTSVDVLVKGSGLSMAQVGGLPAPVVKTFMRVKRWARSHVAEDIQHIRKRKGGPSRPGHTAKRPFMGSARNEDMPPDTMEET
ncbi:uncharacterized protein M421DRAFT_59296 [Didymella exigua CBS 183.55]|uniref:Uncharacterized protein n=1 Tax=Didymella exigua CBS 183.55 TaxID=1150837 RepID=A0A6A5RXU0_9PLEO|nr:uncharacterized protein M421DRAFT_59296 [Didymella exigua CBS 183.55]KAF1930077.1 hypothetical protein M421DRAFT_59296 [Didymella exigua CBS 183.55]